MKKARERASHVVPRLLTGVAESTTGMGDPFTGLVCLSDETTPHCIRARVRTEAPDGVKVHGKRCGVNGDSWGAGFMGRPLRREGR